MLILAHIISMSFISLEVPGISADCSGQKRRGRPSTLSVEALFLNGLRCCLMIVNDVYDNMFVILLACSLRLIFDNYQ